MMLVLRVEVNDVFLVHQRSRLFFDGIIDKSRQLLAPDLLSLDVEEVLNVLDTSLQAGEANAHHLELRFEVLLSTAEDEAIVQHRCKLASELLADAVNEDLFRVDFDDAHECLVED